MTQGIGIVGCGAIGRDLLRAAARGELGAAVVGVNSRSAGPARQFLDTLDSPPPYLDLPELVDRSSLLIETAGGHVVPDAGGRRIRCGKGPDGDKHRGAAGAS